MEKVVLKSVIAHSDYFEELPISKKDCWDLHRLYVNFVKQILELWMFVPAKLVDGVWVVLEEPFNDGQNDQYYLSALDEYQEAKERVLFEGFEYDKHTNQLKNNDNMYLFFGARYCDVYYKNETKFLESIEEITKYNLVLTESAKKQIGI